MRSSTIFAAVLSFVINASVWGQGKSPQVDELRHQIEGLQKQLNKLETGQSSPDDEGDATGRNAATARQPVAYGAALRFVRCVLDLCPPTRRPSATISD